eukprot:SAG25_NODE_7250_length_492_cov_1.290076_1_plen_36_part_01
MCPRPAHFACHWHYRILHMKAQSLTDGCDGLLFFGA